MSSSKESDLREHTYKMALAGAILLISGATIFYHFIESWTWVDSFYFSSVAITTVGFGDLSPTTTPPNCSPSPTYSSDWPWSAWS